MRKFNPERELYKIQHGNRNKIIFCVFLLLVVIGVSSSYALYQVRYSKRIIYTKVAPFNNKDISILAVYVDNTKEEHFPEKNTGYRYDHIDCDNGSTGTFDSIKWELTLTAKDKDKCDVYFVSTYKDASGANAPELYQGLIPVTFDDNGKIYVANIDSTWYNYGEHKWANAVLVDSTKYNTYVKDDKYQKEVEIPMSDILQMYVWIPRYKYQLFNTVNGESKSEQMMEIKFENNIATTGTVTCEINNGGVEKCNGADNGEWFTHPAFTFGNTDLTGIWVGKFEPSDPTNPNGRASNVINEITILPDKTSMVFKSVKTMFDAERDIEKENNKYNLNPNEVDTHMMKNMEWGAVVYLTSSKYGIYSSDGQSCMIVGMTKENCEVWINNTVQGAGGSGSGVTNNWGGTYTGCVGDSVGVAIKWNTADDGSVAKCDDDKKWNTGGVKASTTGNMYGIYDMAGGAWELTMGVIKNEAGTDLYYGGSEFSKVNTPESKYYDVYEFSDSTITHKRGHLGDATRETLKIFGNTTGGWNGDVAAFPFVASSNVFPWFERGGGAGDMSHGGVSAFNYWTGGPGSNGTFRSVLSAV